MKKPNLTFLKFFPVVFLAVTLLLANTRLVVAQDEYRINVNKEFGFANGSDIRGDFSITLFGDETNIASVTFLIDGQDLAVVTEPPFKVKFKTQSYPNGEHQLSAAVTFRDGSIQTLEARRYIFLSAEEESSAMQEIIIPLLAVVFGLTVIGFGVQFLTGRGKPVGGPEPGTPRSYGFAGGSICPKCKRPTPLSMFGLNLVAGRLSRCENCGKWSIMRRRPIAELRAAEAAEIKEELTQGLAPEKSAEDKLRDLLDESRYTKE